MHFVGSSLSTDPNQRNASTKFRKTLESKKPEKSLEISGFLVFLWHELNQPLMMAGMAGLEPTHARVKVWCLTGLATSPYMSVNVFCRTENYYSITKRACQATKAICITFERFFKNRAFRHGKGHLQDVLNKTLWRLSPLCCRVNGV